MSSSLEQDYDVFKFSTENQHEETSVEEHYQNFNNNSADSKEVLQRCEICEQKFQTKKDLEIHTHYHLGKPRVVLKRIANSKTVKKESTNQYWLEAENKGNLKITFKRQSPIGDSLKLKLKKSPVSESFEVVSQSFDLRKERYREYNELAEAHENDSKSDSEEEKAAEQSFENVILNQENNYEEDDENLESEPDHNPLESSERPLMDNNEGDSGVGSDSVNLLEREDQNVDDLQADNISNTDPTELIDHEDPEESENEDPEATVRETIENLKKLGEQSMYIRSRSSELLSTTESPVEEHEDDNDDEEEEEEGEEEEEETENQRTLNPISELQGNSEISIGPRSTVIPELLGNSEITIAPRSVPIAELAGNSEISIAPRSTPISDLVRNSEISISPRSAQIPELTKNSEISIVPKSAPISEFKGNSEISIVPRSALMPEQSTRTSPKEVETEILPVGGSSSSFSWNKISEDSDEKSREDSCEAPEKESSENSENTGSLLQNFLIEQQRNQNESNLSQNLETEYVSLERLAETVNTCRVCNEKFKDIAHLDAHRSKAGHYQCNVPDCGSQVFTTPVELAAHKAQVHGAPVSPSLSNMSPHHLSQNSPHSSRSPHLNQASPHLNTHSPHSPSVQQSQPARNSPMTSPHANSPTYGSQPINTYPGVNLDQLPAPVQQLAQQVQRMPLPQAQAPPSMPPGANTMIPGANYYSQPPGRPPMYRVQAPIHYPPHMAHLYQQFGGNPYGQMGMQPQMQPQIPQQMPRGRYPAMLPGQRGPRMSQPPIPSGPVPRTRLKRPLPPQQSQMPQQLPQQPQGSNMPKQRRMDVLIPGSNEDADCHVIAQQKRNDGLPVIQNVQGGTSVQPTNRNDSTIHLTDSITLSVRQPAQVNATVQGTKKPDASAVANVLAARGITVTPAANNKKNVEQGSAAQQQPQQQQQQQQQQSTQQQKQQLNVSTLNLNSAISIIPASSQRKQQESQGQFAVPQNKQTKQVVNEVERPPRPPTVDLTQDLPSITPVVRRGRPPRMLQSLTCQVCDKRFQSQEMLTQHMATHRTTNKLLHKCNLCPAQYPTSQALLTHKKTYHKEVDTTIQQNGNIELALPVVDLKSPNTLTRLANLGIQSYIPLSQLSAQTGGYFALPIISVDGARNPNSSSLGALGATSILSLGPLKHLSNR